jgi:hypothetical protein
MVERVAKGINAEPLGVGMDKSRGTYQFHHRWEDRFTRSLANDNKPQVLDAKLHGFY